MEICKNEISRSKPGYQTFTLLFIIFIFFFLVFIVLNGSFHLFVSPYYVFFLAIKNSAQQQTLNLRYTISWYFFRITGE